MGAVSAFTWIASVLLQNAFLSDFQHAPGVNLLFLPSGVRLIAIMIGGIWAAVGICFGSLALVGSEFHNVGTLQTAAVAAGSGMFPYVALRASLKVLGIGGNLAGLSARHLPFIALSVALGSSLLHNLLFSLFGLSLGHSFGEHVLAMAAGDFTGILAAVVIVFLFLHFFRRQQR